MIRKRANAENTLRGPKPKNIYWDDFKKYPCPACGNYHDGGGRVLDERGKIAADQSVCPLIQQRQDPIAKRIVVKKPNRFLDTLDQRLSRIVKR